MIDPQLLSYIRQQLLLKVSREVITTNLKGAGWTDADLQEAFTAIAPVAPVIPPTPVVPSVSPAVSPATSPAISPVTPTLAQIQTELSKTGQSVTMAEHSMNPTTAGLTINPVHSQPAAKSKKLFFVILILILLGAGSAGGYYFYLKQKTVAPATLQTENKIANQTPDQTLSVQAPAISNPDIDRVKVILEDMKQGYLTSNKTLLIKHASTETAKFFLSASKINSVSSFTVDSVSQLGANILANITTIPASTPDIVFIKEGDDWKFDMTATFQYEQDQNNAKKGTGDKNGFPDLVVTNITVSPAHPIVNDKNITISVSVKNIGTKTADEVSLEATLIGFIADKTPHQIEDLTAITPGETVMETFTPYKSNDFFKISDTAGQKTIQIVLNKDHKIVESNYNNNVFTQTVQMYSK